MTKVFFTALTLLLGITHASRAASVTVEAESGTLGTNFLVGDDMGTNYISNTNDFTGGGSPGIAGRVATFSVTFPEAGTYALYARIRVGVAAASDDSLFYGNGFGVKTPTLTPDWVQVNNLWNVGYVTGNTNVVLGGGSAMSLVWKWIKLSTFAPGPTFTVTASNLSQTFQIGGREDGLDLDKLLFGTSTNTFTVAELDAGGPGTPPGVVSNRAPVVVNDNRSTSRNTPITVPVLANDSDPDGNPLTLVEVSATNGTPVIVGTNVMYTPVNALGTNTIIYTVTDGQFTNTGLVFIAVTNRPPVASNDTATSPVNVPVSVPVLVNDSDPDGDVLTISSVSPTNGTAVISETNVVFTPTNGLTGTVGYRVSDGFGGTNSALVTIKGTNQAPVVVNDSRSTSRNTPITVPVLANDSDPDGDPLMLVEVSATNGAPVIVGTNVVYTPVNALGTNTIIYTVTDGQFTNTGLVFIAVTNRPPVASNDTATSPVNVPVSVPVLVNDSDPDGDVLTIISVSPTNGTAVISETNVVFTPTNGLTGTVSYRVSDGFGGTNSALVTINGTNPPPANAPQRDLVAGNLIQFNDNGAWSWYMDERAVVDQTNGRFIVGGDASTAGVGGSPRNGAVDAAMFDLQTRTVQRTELMSSGPLGCDDHNAPAFMVRPDGKCLAQWAGHNANFLSYFRILDGNTWLPQTTFDWTSAGATGSGETTSYSNPHYLAAENRVYTFVRCIENRSPHFLVSTNLGNSWTYGGQLVEPDGVVGYNSGYFRYCDNGVDRIDFICTEAHPRDISTSMYHGYISNGMSFKSDGTVVDTNLFDTICPVSRNFTPIFTNGTVMPPGQTNYRCWNSDVQRYSDGSIHAIIHARINNNTGGNDTGITPNHAFFFCRYNGTNWTTTYLCQAGTKMYSSEADYVGLGTLPPNDPNTIFISTRYDPRAVQPGVFDTNQPYSTVREIWKGVTTNHGASFSWTQITRDSIRDNFRPLIPAWDANNTVLLWFRGTYNSAQSYDAAIVGLVERRSEIEGVKTFVDATTNNTTLATGAALVPDAGANQWHERSGSFNGGAVLASADVSAENAAALKTSVTPPQSGTYDVWVNFWGNPAADWRIKAGLATNQMKILRQRAGQQVEPGDHTSPLILTMTNSSTNFLYQAYVGRVTGGTIEVFVDDEPIQTGTVSTQIGNTVRTWYDGISYAKIDVASTLTIQSVSNSGPAAITLVWNSLPPTWLLSPQTFTVQKKGSLDEANWTTVATGIPSAGSTTTFTDDSATANAAFYRVASP